MGAEYTEAQKRATANYMKDKKTLRVVVTDERKKIIETHAEKYDGSINAFINRAINETMEMDNKVRRDCGADMRKKV